MSGTISIDPTLAPEGGNPLDQYRSRPRQLATWLLTSRDALREKYQELKIDSKRLKVRISDVVKSRDHWRQRAEVSDQQVRAMKVEVKRLTAQIKQTVDSDLKKVNCHSVR